jgi:hypothetical protein
VLVAYKYWLSVISRFLILYSPDIVDNHICLRIMPPKQTMDVVRIKVYCKNKAVPHLDLYVHCA